MGLWGEGKGGNIYAENLSREYISNYKWVPGRAQYFLDVQHTVNNNNNKCVK